MIELRSKLDEFITINQISKSLRVSVKVNKNGHIDSNRYTYKFIGLSEIKIDEIMSLLTDNVGAKNYILERINDRSSFFVSLDDKSVKFYLDYPFKMNVLSMISVEIIGDDSNNYKIRNYTPGMFKMAKIPRIYRHLLKYIQKNIILERDDFQNYIRFKKEIEIPSDIFLSLSEDSIFVNFIKEHGKEPLWFQYSESSFTLYFKID